MEIWEKYKKIFLVLIFLLITLVLGYGIYSLFFRPAFDAGQTEEPQNTADQKTGLPEPGDSGQPNIDNTTDTVDTNLPETTDEENGGAAAEPDQTAIGGLTATEAIIDSPGLGATLGSNGSDVQYYDRDKDKFFRVDKNGEVEELSDKTFHDVEKITWSPNKNKAIIEYPDGANIIYDFNTKQQTTLPKHWKDFNYSADGKQIVMKSIGLDPDNRWLAIANDDGSNVRPIEALGDKDETVFPSWSPNNQTVAMFTENEDFDRQKLYFVGKNNENFKSTVIEGRGFQPKWTNDGQKLLYSVYSSDNDMKPTLWIVGAQGEEIGSNRHRLNIDTWADKCVFAAGTDMYCAVPENLEEGAGIFPELAKTTKDRLYKIDTETGLKKVVAIPDGDFAMSNLIVSQNGYYLYFTDEKTGLVNKIKLK